MQITEADKLAKREAIEAYFSEYNERVQYLGKLIDDKRDLESMILTCAYIEGIGNCVFTKCNDSGKNFVDIIREYGGQKLMMLVSPSKLIESLSKRKSDEKRLVEIVSKALDPYMFMLLETPEIINILKCELNAEDFELINLNIWRGTLAYFTYIHLRCNSIKKGLAWSSYSFSKTTYNGEILGSVNFVEILYKALLEIARHITDISIKTDKFYGSDFIADS